MQLNWRKVCSFCIWCSCLVLFQNPNLKHYGGRNEVREVPVFFLQLYLLGKSSVFFFEELEDPALVIATLVTLSFCFPSDLCGFTVITLRNIYRYPSWQTLHILFWFAVAVKMLTQAVPFKSDITHMTIQKNEWTSCDILNPDGWNNTRKTLTHF